MNPSGLSPANKIVARLPVKPSPHSESQDGWNQICCFSQTSPSGNKHLTFDGSAQSQSEFVWSKWVFHCYATSSFLIDILNSKHLGFERSGLRVAGFGHSGFWTLGAENPKCPKSSHIVQQEKVSTTNVQKLTLIVPNIFPLNFF